MIRRVADTRCLKCEKVTKELFCHYFFARFTINKADKNRLKHTLAAETVSERELERYWNEWGGTNENLFYCNDSIQTFFFFFRQNEEKYERRKKTLNEKHPHKCERKKEERTTSERHTATKSNFGKTFACFEKCSSNHVVERRVGRRNREESWKSSSRL